jgi:hypothetical protein
MLNTNLILVDGLPGSGKSTTAQIVWLQLLRNGYEADWFFEHQSSHPIYRYEDPEEVFQTTAAESKKIHDEALHNWEKLASSLQGTRRVTILESTIFQTTIGWLQLIDCDRSEILDYALRVRQVIEELNPCLIYLYQDDIAGGLRRTCDLRGEEFELQLVSRIARTPYGKRANVRGFEGVATFYKAVREITDHLYSTWQTHKVSLETSEGDWKMYHHRIAEFLGMVDVELRFSSPEAGRFAGRYTEVNSGSEITVAADQDGLYFDEPHRPRLFHRFDSTFCIQGMCVDLAFKHNETGLVTAVECSGDLPGVAGFWVKN